MGPKAICEVCGDPNASVLEPGCHRVLVGGAYNALTCALRAVGRVTAERDEARADLDGAHELLRVTREAHGESLAEVARLRKALEDAREGLGKLEERYPGASFECDTMIEWLDGTLGTKTKCGAEITDGCGFADPHRCTLAPGHAGDHSDEWGTWDNPAEGPTLALSSTGDEGEAGLVVCDRGHGQATAGDVPHPRVSTCANPRGKTCECTGPCEWPGECNNAPTPAPKEEP